MKSIRLATYLVDDTALVARLVSFDLDAGRGDFLTTESGDAWELDVRNAGEAGKAGQVEDTGFLGDRGVGNLGHIYDLSLLIGTVDEVVDGLGYVGEVEGLGWLLGLTKLDRSKVFWGLGPFGLGELDGLLGHLDCWLGRVLDLADRSLGLDERCLSYRLAGCLRDDVEAGRWLRERFLGLLGSLRDDVEAGRRLRELRNAGLLGRRVELLLDGFLGSLSRRPDFEDRRGRRHEYGCNGLLDTYHWPGWLLLGRVERSWSTLVVLHGLGGYQVSLEWLLGYPDRGSRWFERHRWLDQGPHWHTPGLVDWPLRGSLADVPGDWKSLLVESTLVVLGEVTSWPGVNVVWVTAALSDDSVLGVLAVLY